MADHIGSEQPAIGRRALLTTAGLGVVAGAGWLIGPDRIRAGVGAVLDGARDVAGEAREGMEAPGPRPRPTAVASDSLPDYRELGGARLVYEVDGVPSRFPMEPGFGDRLNASLLSHWQAAGWARPAELSSYGTWRSGPAAGEVGSSWHHAGRAFDVGRVTAADGAQLVSCRYDLWGGGPEHDLQAAAYWRLAATLHRDFEYVLTYLFDEAHHNHIHVDNGRSGDEGSTFSRGARVQVQAVQAMCRYVWGLPVELSSRWDGPTSDATGEVLRRIGVGGALTRGQESWHAFLTATARHTPG